MKIQFGGDTTERPLRVKMGQKTPGTSPAGNSLASVHNAPNPLADPVDELTPESFRQDMMKWKAQARMAPPSAAANQAKVHQVYQKSLKQLKDTDAYKRANPAQKKTMLARKMREVASGSASETAVENYLEGSTSARYKRRPNETLREYQSRVRQEESERLRGTDRHQKAKKQVDEARKKMRDAAKERDEAITEARQAVAQGQMAPGAAREQIQNARRNYRREVAGIRQEHDFNRNQGVVEDTRSRGYDNTGAVTMNEVTDETSVAQGVTRGPRGGTLTYRVGEEGDTWTREQWNNATEAQRKEHAHKMLGKKFQRQSQQHLKSRDMSAAKTKPKPTPQSNQKTQQAKAQQGGSSSQTQKAPPPNRENAPANYSDAQTAAMYGGKISPGRKQWLKRNHPQMYKKWQQGKMTQQEWSNLSKKIPQRKKEQWHRNANSLDYGNNQQKYDRKHMKYNANKGKWESSYGWGDWAKDVGKGMLSAGPTFGDAVGMVKDWF